MAGEFLGKGFAFPMRLNSDGLLMQAEKEEDIREAIGIILSTAKGERQMRPEFGCGIHDYVFAVLNTATLGLIETAVREALVLWEPRIDLTSVDALTTEIENSKLLIEISYTVRSTNNRFNLVYPFYLTEGEA